MIECSSGLKKGYVADARIKKKENNERLSPLAPLVVYGKRTGHLRSLSVRWVQSLSAKAWQLR